MQGGMKRMLGSLVQQQCQRMHAARATIVRKPNTNHPQETSTKICSVSPDSNKRMIRVHWEDGKAASFPYVWLRDCAPFATQPDHDLKCKIVADTRTLTLFELNVQVKPEKVSLNLRGDGVCIQWPPYYEVVYRSDWLRDHVWTTPNMSVSENAISLWGRSDLEKCLPQTTADELCSGDKGVLRQKLTEFAKYGVLLVRGGGSGDMRALRSLGYDVAQLEPNKFRAYHHHVQGMHTGAPYKSTIPPLCLLFIREEPEDISLQICDGFRVAHLLREAHPSLFTFLCNTLIEYNVKCKEGRQKGHRWPVFTLTASGDFQQVVFNNALRSPRTNVPLDTVEDYYKALKTFNSYCYQSRNMYNLHVREGDLVFIANQRILHGNPAFSDNVANWVDEVFLSDEPLMQTLKEVQG